MCDGLIWSGSNTLTEVLALGRSGYKRHADTCTSVVVMPERRTALRVVQGPTAIDVISWNQMGM